jgi:hypothetical protein
VATLLLIQINMNTSAILLTLPLSLLCACFHVPDVNAQVQQAQQNANAAMANANAMIANAQALSQSRVDGSVTVNNQPFSPTKCISGSIQGFNGADLMAVDGSRLRIVQEVDGSETVIQMGTGSNPVTLKACGKIDLQSTGVMVNGIRVVRGTAQIDCSAGSLHVAGNVSFQCGT